MLFDKLSRWTKERILHHSLRRLPLAPAATRITLDVCWWIEKIEYALKWADVHCQPVHFVQVGANNGLDQFHSQIIGRGWSGLFVEPNPSYFASLKKNYETYLTTGRFAFENVAIDDETRDRWLYLVDPERADLPAWSQGLASFDPQHILRHGQEFEGAIQKINVHCDTLENVMSRHPEYVFSVLICDTEGFDSNVVRQALACRVVPKVIIFEYKHLTKNDAENLYSEMAARGFVFGSDHADTVAIRLT